MPGPLAGVRVADFSRVLSGPFATMTLGDLGADVIKVERPGDGDETRGWGPPFAGGESAYYLSVNRNKRSIALDLRDPGGLEAARALCASSHVLVENFRPGTMDKLGLGFEAARALNPAIVYCSISGFGLEGPDARRPGYDFVVQGEGGVMHITGEPDGPPQKVGVAISDITAGMYATIAILSALRHAERTGEGQQVHVSLLASTLGWLANQSSNWLVGGSNPRRLGNRHPNIVPYQVFDASDGPLVVAVGNEALWGRFCDAMRVPELRDDPSFATNADRVRNRDALAARLDALFSGAPRAHWLEVLERAQIPCGPVNDVAEALSSSFGASRVETVEHPTVGELRLVRSPLDLSVTPVATRLPPPLLGEHTDDVLAELEREER